MRTFLLDANVAIALSVAEHEHHDRTSRWLATADRFAVCPIVEGALVRFVLRLGETPSTARALLGAFEQHPRCDFWPDDLPYGAVDLQGLHGHRMVTDAYLAALAQHHGATLATLATALAGRLPAPCSSRTGEPGSTRTGAATVQV